MRAKTLVQRLDLTPPVNITALLSARAQVEYVDWSHECDAVTILGAEVPRVFVRSGMAPLRERFTLAHELAHIELAWHVGTVDCHVDSIDSDYSTATLNGTQEREANEFASRLLAPDRWLAPLVKDVSSFERAAMQSLLENLATAEMSAHAGLIALSRHLVPGHAFFIDQGFAISKGTPWPGMPPLGQIEVEQYLERSVTVEEFAHQGRKVFWARTVPPAPLPPGSIDASADERTPHQVLIDCCTRAFGQNEAQKKSMSVNGIVGGITSDPTLPWNENAITSVVRHRIQSRDDLRELLKDPEFSVYLQKRATAIVLRRASATE